MTKNVKKVDLKESTVYDNCVGVKVEEDSKPGSLVEFLGLEEEDDTKEWQKHWVGMPEFVQEDNPPYKKLIISFRTKEDYDEFAGIVNQSLTEKTKSIWYPKLDRDENTLKRWILDDGEDN